MSFPASGCLTAVDDERRRGAGPVAGAVQPLDAKVLVLAAGRSRPHDEAAWRDAIVLVERGQVELETRSGGRRRFAGRPVLFLTGLPLLALHNPGTEPAVLVAVSPRPGRYGRDGTAGPDPPAATLHP